MPPAIKKVAYICLIIACAGAAIGADYYPYTSNQADNMLNLVKGSRAIRFRVIENSPYCRKTAGVYGYVEYPDPVTYGAVSAYGICSRRIIQEGNQSQFDRVIFHESVHASQACHPRQWLLGIPLSTIPRDLKKWVRTNSLYQGNTEESNKSEYEAYYLEDYPGKVAYYVKAHCYR